MTNKIKEKQLIKINVLFYITYSDKLTQINKKAKQGNPVLKPEKLKGQLHCLLDAKSQEMASIAKRFVRW